MGKDEEEMVGAERFELPTLWSQTRCATRLRYAPTNLNLYLINIKFQELINNQNLLDHQHLFEILLIYLPEFQ